MAVTSPRYTKLTPRVTDYNPILHAPLYKQWPMLTNFQTMYRSTYAQDPMNPFSKKSPSQSPTRPGRPFEQVRGPLGRSAAAQFDRTPVQGLLNERLYKTRPRNVFVNSITGTVQHFNTTEINSLDAVVNKPVLAETMRRRLFHSSAPLY